MKKIWLIMLAMLLAFGLVISCGGDDDDDNGTGGGSDDPILGAPVVRTLNITNNQYGDGVQMVFKGSSANEFFGGTYPSNGDEFELKMTFYLNRDIPIYPGSEGQGELTVGISCGGEACCSYWFNIMEGNAVGIGGKNLKKDTKYEGTVVFNIVGVKTPACALSDLGFYFQTEKEVENNDAVAPPLVVKCSVFSFTKK